MRHKFNNRYFRNPVLLSSFLLAVLIGMFTQAIATEVYITHDKDGNPIFSDQPSSDAEKIIIEDIQTVPKVQTQTQPASGTSQKLKELPKYTEFKIVSPVDDESIRENTGALSVQVALSPKLRGNDQIVLYLDGAVVLKGRETTFNLTNIDRGTHSLLVAIESASGKQEMRSTPVTVHLLRFSQVTN